MKLNKSLYKILNMEDNDLLDYCHKRLMSSGYNNIYRTNDYVIAVGETPIALVAHLDTVHKVKPRLVNYDEHTGIVTSFFGLGADDRAGVYSIFQLLETKPTVIFCMKEEVGGIGASAVIKDFPVAPMDLKYMIELDRSGYQDAVFYDCDSVEFTDYIETFGWKESWGSFSDISIIAPQWKVAAVNLSIGYEHQHTLREKLSIPAMNNTINIVKQMLTNVPEQAYVYVESDYRSKYSYLYDYDLNNTWKRDSTLYAVTNSKYNYSNEEFGYDYNGNWRMAGINEFVCDCCCVIHPFEEMEGAGTCGYCNRNKLECSYCGNWVPKEDIVIENCCVDCLEVLTGKDDVKLGNVYTGEVKNSFIKQGDVVYANLIDNRFKNMQAMIEADKNMLDLTVVNLINKADENGEDIPTAVVSIPGHNNYYLYSVDCLQLY